MKKQTKILTAVFVVVLALLSAAAFLAAEEKNGQFWVSYIFGVISLTAMFLGTLRTARDADQPSGYLAATVSGIYLVLTALWIFYGYVRIQLFFGLYLAAHLVLLAGYVAVMAAGVFGHRYIVSQGDEVRRQVLSSRMLTESVTGLLAFVGDLPEANREEVRAALSKVEEKLRYSDPTQSEALADYDRDVRDAVSGLASGMERLRNGQGDPAELLKAAENAVQKIDTRNRMAKLAK